jgi:hypothetical protein
MSDRRPWYEGTSDPLDTSAQLVEEYGLKPNARSLAVPIASQVTTSIELLNLDPLDVLLQCEEADEAEGCACGEHLAEFYHAAH